MCFISCYLDYELVYVEFHSLQLITKRKLLNHFYHVYKEIQIYLLSEKRNELITALFNVYMQKANGSNSTFSIEWSTRMKISCFITFKRGKLIQQCVNVSIYKNCVTIWDFQNIFSNVMIWFRWKSSKALMIFSWFAICSGIILYDIYFKMKEISWLC